MSQPQAITHYENFPVASWLCPARLRPPIAAIYHFARTADDLADEGQASADERLADLQAYRQDLEAIIQGQPTSTRWPAVFQPLGDTLRQWPVAPELLGALLNAFEQDVRYTAAQQRYEDDAQLLDYCTRSANPVGRLLLQLYQQTDALSLQQSDQICTGLQLANFWQDLHVDLGRGRIYPSVQTMARWNVTLDDLNPHSQSPRARYMVQAYVTQARWYLCSGAPLALRLPGRVGWELRAVVQGGLRILERIEALDCASWRQRPVLGKPDALRVLWRCLWMRA